VAPDNGVLTAAFGESPLQVVELTEPAYARPTVSRTFEGRDRFAPAAAWLATGLAIESLGPVVADYQRLTMPAPDVREDGVRGVVVHVDRFGNLITNIHRTMYENATRDRPVVVRVGSHAVARLVHTYADVAPGELCALSGSTDHLEIAVNRGSAEARLALGRGAPVSVLRS
jgi:S-adenosylmethionine hydrolase